MPFVSNRVWDKLVAGKHRKRPTKNWADAFKVEFDSKRSTLARYSEKDIINLMVGFAREVQQHNSRGGKRGKSS